ncbi:hypothetical protein [Streptomyces sp. SID3343]|uniref:hypothetical protein n=1 Tax=Streptomyces sp. SID3343 TaxID=2690260 RepID=UPI001F3E5418|nr:hypothetical protein [Streptomyces sp. SID3343]
MTAVDDTTTGTPGLDHAALVAALHRRIADRIAGHRAADTKAGLLLAVIGVSAPALEALPAGLAVGAGAGLALAGVLLVLLPRTDGWLQPTRDLDPDRVLRLIADRETPRELAAEHERLGRITAGKYALIRAALIVLALTTATGALACTIH